MRNLAFVIILAMSTTTASVVAQTIIAQWNFNTEALEPAKGSGTAVLLGNVAGSFAAGSSGDSSSASNRALNIAGFPSQGENARTAGVQFAIDTTGYENIMVSWDQRFSATASRRAVFQVSTDGENFHDVFVLIAPGEGWTNSVVVDLSGQDRVSDNPLFVFRIVSDFDQEGLYMPAKPGSTYSSAGTWRFDRVTISGSVIGTQAEPPVIVEQPADLTVAAGQDASFSVVARGTEPLHYQWWFGDSPVLGATNGILKIPSVGKANEGIYSVVVSNWLSSVSSTPAFLRVISPPTIQFTNFLENLIRPGDAQTNTFSEFALHPGEVLAAQVYVSDSEGGPVSVTTECDPPQTTFSWLVDDSTIAFVAGTFRFSPTENDLGQLFSIHLSACNELAATTAVWKVYVPTKVEQNLVLTEYLANPASSPESPFFNPLRRSQPAPNPTQQDEFIELVNLADAAIDLHGWTIADSAQIRHRFSDTVILPVRSSIVIYGGPVSENFPTLDVPYIPASAGSGLSLNNSGDTILMRNADSNLVTRIVYTPKMISPEGSMTRWPDANGPFVAHSVVAESPVSPGRQPCGGRWDQQTTDQHIQGLRISFQSDGNLELDWETIETSTYTVWVAEFIEGPYVPLAAGLKEGRYRSLTGPEQCRFYRVSSP